MPTSRHYIVALLMALGVSSCGVEDGGFTNPGVTPGTDDAAASGVVGPPVVAERPDAMVVSVPDGGAVVTPDAAVSPDAAPDAPAVIVDAAPPPPPDAPPSSPDAAAPISDQFCSDDPSLLLCLTFEGDAIDHSPLHQQGTVGNVRFTDGPDGKTADVRAGSVITFPSNPLYGSPGATIEAWVDPRSLAARAGIVDSNGRYGLFALQSGNAYCVGGGTAFASGVMKPGSWVSLACTFDAREVVIYVNGKPAGRAPSTYMAGRGNAGVTIGSDDPGGHALDGFVDNVRVWNVVRTPDQICTGARECRPSAQRP